MNTHRLNEWLTLSANIAVLFGIGFLAYELRQNNQNLAAELRAVHFESTADVWRMAAENPTIAELVSKEELGEDMTNAEIIQLRSFWTRYQLAVQYAWAELPDSEFQQFLPWAKGTYFHYPEYRAAWKLRRSLFDPEFVAYIEENAFLQDER